MSWLLSGCRISGNLKMKQNNTLEAIPVTCGKKIKDQKAPKATQIVVGRHVHLRGYQATRKIDNATIGAVANLRSERALLLYMRCI
jgi:hypothetical protein